MADKTATFSTKFVGNAASVSAMGAALEALRASIEKSQIAIKQQGATLRSLRGSSEEVTGARKTLQTSIDAERDAVSRHTLALIKAGTSYDALAKKTKAASSTAKEFEKAVSSVGGPVADASSKVSALSSVLELCQNPMVALGVVAAALVLGVTALAAATIAATSALAKFALESANVLRAQGLAREAIAGTSEDAARMGHQLDFVAQKLATPREKLNDLYVSIRKTFDGTRISGQGMVDTFAAVASASEAAGDDVGRSLLGILERSKRFGRVGLNPFELQGTGGPQFADIAAALAKQTKIGVDRARLELLTGRVPIDAAAAAIAAAVETRFGLVNAKKLLDLNVLSTKLHENWINLTKGISLEPLLVGLKQVVDLFSETSSTGQTLQAFFTSFGGLVSAAFQAALPYVITGLKEAINLALRFAIGLVDLASTVWDFAHSAVGTIAFRTGLILLAGSFVVLATVAIAAFAAMGVAAATVVAPFVAIGTAVAGVITAVQWLATQDWPKIGAAIVDGITRGLASKWEELKAKVASLADGITGVFRAALGIHSPSTVFALYGRNTVEGFAQGVTQSQSEAYQAVSQLAPAPAEASGQPSGAGGGGGAITIRVEFHFQGGSAREAAAAVSDPSVLGQVTHALEVAARSLGIPTRSPAPA